VLPKVFTDGDVEFLFKSDPRTLHLIQRTRPGLFFDLEERAYRLGLILQKTQSGDSKVLRFSR
jgi:hypothetical protein